MNNEGKTHKNLVKKITSYILRGMIALTLLMLVGSAVLNGFAYKSSYNIKTLQIAKSSATLSDSEYLEELYAAVTSEEFISLERSDDRDEDEAIVKGFLEDRGLLDGFEAEVELLNDLREDMGAEYLYVQVIREDHSCVTLIDPFETYETIGMVDDLSDSVFANLVKNEEVVPVVSKSEFGWLSTGGEPVCDASGEPIAVAFCDLDVTDMV
ncbi:MAG: hypothetical protein K6G07_06250, partial [Lachnospiraceae bacterium]|nr:hypothetical protein [Lachnospiraceae bacterium]